MGSWPMSADHRQQSEDRRDTGGGRRDQADDAVRRQQHLRNPQRDGQAEAVSFNEIAQAVTAAHPHRPTQLEASDGPG